MCGAMLLGLVSFTQATISKTAPVQRILVLILHYVEDYYYCESGSAGFSNNNAFHASDPLWDGRGCPAGDDCCSTLGAPWFYHHFTEPEKGAVEVRICRDEIYSNEATLLEQVQLYIQ